MPRRVISHATTCAYQGTPLSAKMENAGGANFARKRFATHTEDEINEKRANIIPKNTSKANCGAANLLRDYLREKEQEADFEKISKVRLAEILGHFYMDARKKDGEYYKASTMDNFRHSLNRYLHSPPHMITVDIINDSEFTDANECFRTAMAELKAAGKGAIDHHPLITDADRKKLYSSMRMSPLTPYGLANKVQFDIRLYFCRRGMENMEKMSKSSFVIKTDSNTGLRYVTKNADELTKNHREWDRENITAFMPEDKNSPFCPVSSFERYVTKLNPNCDRLWQYPLDSYAEESDVWYANRPIGRDSLAKFMSTLSSQCNLSQVYTNHSIRTTGVTILTRCKFVDSQIKSITGHKSSSSLSVYQRTSDDEKLEMGQAINQGIDPGKTVRKSLPAAVNSSEARQIMPPTQLRAIQTAGNTTPAPPVPCAPGPVILANGPRAQNPLGNVDLNQLLCDFDQVPVMNFSAMTNNSVTRPSPMFQNCSIGTLHVTIHK